MAHSLISRFQTFRGIFACGYEHSDIQKMPRYLRKPQFISVLLDQNWVKSNLDFLRQFGIDTFGATGTNAVGESILADR